MLNRLRKKETDGSASSASASGSGSAGIKKQEVFTTTLEALEVAAAELVKNEGEGVLCKGFQLARAIDDHPSKMMELKFSKGESLKLTTFSQKAFPRWKGSRRANPKKSSGIPASKVRVKLRNEWNLEDVMEFAARDEAWQGLIERPTHSENDLYFLILTGMDILFETLVQSLKEIAEIKDLDAKSMRICLQQVSSEKMEDPVNLWCKQIPEAIKDRGKGASEVIVVLDKYVSMPSALNKLNVVLMAKAIESKVPVTVTMSRDLNQAMRFSLPDQVESINKWVVEVGLTTNRASSLCTSGANEAFVEVNDAVEEEILREARGMGLETVKGVVRELLVNWLLKNCVTVLQRLEIRIIPTNLGAPETGLKQYAPENKQLARSAANLGFITGKMLAAHDEDKWGEAKQALVRSLDHMEISGDASPQSHLRQCQILCLASECCLHLGEKGPGLRFAEKAKSIIEELQGKRSQESSGETDVDLCAVDIFEQLAKLHLKGTDPDRQSALTTLQVLMQLKTRIFGESHVEVLKTLQEEVNLHMEMKNGSAAMLGARKSLEMSQAINGDSHPHTAKAYNILGKALYAQTQETEALKMLQKAVDIQTKVFGASNSTTLRYQNDLDRLGGRSH